MTGGLPNGALIIRITILIVIVNISIITITRTSTNTTTIANITTKIISCIMLISNNSNNNININIVIASMPRRLTRASLAPCSQRLTEALALEEAGSFPSVDDRVTLRRRRRQGHKRPLLPNRPSPTQSNRRTICTQHHVKACDNDTYPKQGHNAALRTPARVPATPPFW